MPEIRDRITELRRVKASDLLANPRNWRKHPSSQASALSAVLQEVGYADALLARETPEGLCLIDGHLRQKLTPDQDVPVLVLDVTEDEANKILLTLDPLAALAESDKHALDGLLRDVTTGDAALQEMLSDLAKDNGLTYGTQEIATAPEPEIDRAEELQKKWKTELGQLWQIGNHRLLCGDSTAPQDVERVLGNTQPDLCFTDPPYNVGKEYGDGFDDKKPYEEYREWCRRWFTLARQNCKGIVFTPGAVNVWMWPEIEKPKWMSIWVKMNQQSRNRAGGWNAYEPFLVYGNVKIDFDVWNGAVRQSAKLEGMHDVPKTLLMWSEILRDVIHQGRLVYEPFAGAGTTFVAAEQLKYICYGIDSEPKYVAVTLERLFQMGLQPMPADRVKQQTYIVHSSVVPANA